LGFPAGAVAIVTGLSDEWRRKENGGMEKTTACPHCGNPATETIVLGDADRDLEGLLECGCGAMFTEAAAADGSAEAYRHPRLGIDLFRASGTYVSIPSASLV
jgi:hypothetical protein